MASTRFIVCDCGKTHAHYFDPMNDQYGIISLQDFVDLNIPGLKRGMIVIIEDAHIHSQEGNSLAQPFDILQLNQLQNRASECGVTILCFPQKVTPKARKIASLENPDLLEKGDENDVRSIALYLEFFPEVINSLKEFNPCTLDQHQERTEHIYADRDRLTDQSNTARNEGYGIKTDYTDPVTEWIKSNIVGLATSLDDDTREWAGLEYNAKKTGLKPGLVNYTSDKLKFIYGVVLTVLDSETGQPRLRSDIGLPPYWKYAKKVWFGLTPYHMRAGVTASNYKYHKRKAGSPCKKSMSLESKKAIKSIDDVREIREAMKTSDKNLQKLWGRVREMIVEQGIR